MMGLLVLKEQLKIFYGKHNRIVSCGIHFLLAFTTFYMLNQNIGFYGKAEKPGHSSGTQSDLCISALWCHNSIGSSCHAGTFKQCIVWKSH